MGPSIKDVHSNGGGGKPKEEDLGRGGGGVGYIPDIQKKRKKLMF